MDDGALSFDFESHLHQQEQQRLQSQRHGGGASSSYAQQGGGGGLGGQGRYKETVCKFWLLSGGKCMRGDACGFLHTYDEARIPVCPDFARTGTCLRPNCPFKHTEEDIKDCKSFKMGFCVLGPRCQYRHLRLPRDQLPPVKTAATATNE